MKSFKTLTLWQRYELLYYIYWVSDYFDLVKPNQRQHKKQMLFLTAEKYGGKFRILEWHHREISTFLHML